MKAKNSWYQLNFDSSIYNQGPDSDDISFSIPCIGDAARLFIIFFMTLLSKYLYVISNSFVVSEFTIFLELCVISKPIL